MQEGLEWALSVGHSALGLSWETTHSPRQLKSVPSALLWVVSKPVHALHILNLSFFYSHLVSPTGFQPAKGTGLPSVRPQGQGAQNVI